MVVVLAIAVSSQTILLVVIVSGNTLVGVDHLELLGRSRFLDILVVC